MVYFIQAEFKFGTYTIFCMHFDPQTTLKFTVDVFFSADMLLLGSTGKAIRPTNQNSGVASVASVTLQKLVVPLKALMINDRELTFLREIVLFNPGKQ